MDVEERSQRAASVLSGMSAEDMEAAETLKSLHQGKNAEVEEEEKKKLTLTSRRNLTTFTAFVATHAGTTEYNIHNTYSDA